MKVFPTSPIQENRRLVADSNRSPLRFCAESSVSTEDHGCHLMGHLRTPLGCSRIFPEVYSPFIRLAGIYATRGFCHTQPPGAIRAAKRAGDERCGPGRASPGEREREGSRAESAWVCEPRKVNVFGWCFSDWPTADARCRSLGCGRLLET